MPDHHPGAPQGARIAYLVVSLLVLALLLEWAWGVLLPFVLAALLTYLLAPVVDRLEGMGWHRILSILIAYAVVGAVMAGAVLYILPQAVQQTIQLARVLPQFAATGEETWNRLLQAFHEAPMPAAMRAAISGSVKNGEQALLHHVKNGLNLVLGLLPGLIAVVASPILGFYLLKDLTRIKARFWHLLPYAWHGPAFKLGRDLDRVLSGYVRGQLLVALVVGIMAGIWSALVGVPFSLLIGVLVGITDVVPYVGPVVGALPAVLLALSHNVWTAVWVMAGFALIHEIEGTVLAPKIIGDAVDLHPLLVVLVILVGGELSGIPGMLVAVPVGAVLNVLARHLYRMLAQARSPELPAAGQSAGS
ncbi:MAG: AI-2E family transporter [Clostridia bacterium]